MLYVMSADEPYVLHVTAAMLREMHLFSVYRRMTVHRYVVHKTGKCGSVTQPCCTLHSIQCVFGIIDASGGCSQ